MSSHLRRMALIELLDEGRGGERLHDPLLQGELAWALEVLVVLIRDAASLHALRRERVDTIWNAQVLYHGGPPWRLRHGVVQIALGHSLGVSPCTEEILIRRGREAVHHCQDITLVI